MWAPPAAAVPRRGSHRAGLVSRQHLGGLVGRDDNCLNPELAEFRAWDQVFGVLQDWNRSLVAQEPPKDGP
jgi:hypothetical protein